MSRQKPSQVFQGKIVIIAPHMDDEVLACGGMIAQFPDKHCLYCIYVTDGSRSPMPLYPWQGKVTLDLSVVRKQEAKNAMSVLGIPEENLFFLGLPDMKLRHHKQELTERLKECLEKTNPTLVLVPFRYDRHPDHITINHVISNLKNSGNFAFELIEYFVYYRWRLLPGKDVRKFVHSDHLIEIDILPQAFLKKRALQAYLSQTTQFFPWQDRPILQEERVEEVSRSAELFLRYNPNLPAASIFRNLGLWIQIDHLLEPMLKNWKEHLVGLFNMTMSQ